MSELRLKEESTLENEVKWVVGGNLLITSLKTFLQICSTKSLKKIVKEISTPEDKLIYPYPSVTCVTIKGDIPVDDILNFLKYMQNETKLKDLEISNNSFMDLFGLLSLIEVISSSSYRLKSFVSYYCPNLTAKHLLDSSDEALNTLEHFLTTVRDGGCCMGFNVHSADRREFIVGNTVHLLTCF
jgi:hypothetical protein